MYFSHPGDFSIHNDFGTSHHCGTLQDSINECFVPKKLAAIEVLKKKCCEIKTTIAIFVICKPAPIFDLMCYHFAVIKHCFTNGCNLKQAARELVSSITQHHNELCHFSRLKQFL